MITRIVIPQLFENMEEATIGAWRQKEGEVVASGSVLCELITEKTTFDLEAESGGVLRRVVAAEKSVVPVGFVIAIIGEPQESLPDVDVENAALIAGKQGVADAPEEALHVPSLNAPPLSTSAIKTAPATPPQNEPQTATAPIARLGGSASAGASGSRVRATPAARRAARDAGASLEAVAAAFPGKVLSEEDVNSYVSGAKHQVSREDGEADGT